MELEAARQRDLLRPPPGPPAARARRGSRRSGPRRGPGNGHARSRPDRGWRGCRDSGASSLRFTRTAVRTVTRRDQRRAIVPAAASAVFFRILLARGFIGSYLRPPKWNGPAVRYTRRDTFFRRPEIPPDLLLFSPMTMTATSAVPAETPVAALVERRRRRRSRRRIGSLPAVRGRGAPVRAASPAQARGRRRVRPGRHAGADRGAPRRDGRPSPARLGGFVLGICRNLAAGSRPPEGTARGALAAVRQRRWSAGGGRTARATRSPTRSFIWRIA